MARCFVTNQRSVPCRLMNPSPEVQIIHSGTVVANLTPVDGIMQEHKVPMEQNNELPETLKELLHRSCKGLSQQQIKNLKSLLLQNVNLFSKDDRDFGRTDIVKHSINTGSRAPIRLSEELQSIGRTI